MITEIPADVAPPQELARQIWDHLNEHPDEHNQHSWISGNEKCGTTRCIAGWAVFFAFGRDIRLSTDGYFEMGGQLLGLDEDEACHLFLGTGNRAAMEALQYIAKGDPIDWEAIYPGRRHT